MQDQKSSEDRIDTENIVPEYKNSESESNVSEGLKDPSVSVIGGIFDLIGI